MAETFEEYIGRLRHCKGLEKKLRNEAADKLEHRYNVVNSNATNSQIRFVKMAKDPTLYGMFDWSRTKEGHPYWKMISEAGF